MTEFDVLTAYDLPETTKHYCTIDYLIKTTIHTANSENMFVHQKP